jgi:hypothetical protein
LDLNWSFCRRYWLRRIHRLPQSYNCPHTTFLSVTRNISFRYLLFSYQLSPESFKYELFLKSYRLKLQYSSNPREKLFLSASVMCT